jgi:hypothetical protein
LIFHLAVAIQNQPDESNTKRRYLYLPIFWYKTESICTHYLNSHTLALKPHPFISKQSFKSCVRDFAHICSGLNTDPLHSQIDSWDF